MLSKIRNGFLAKAVALTMTISLVFDGILNTALALTGGPAAPEFNSFEPFSTNQMVDLFSGDFTYNVPLLSVPGPNGGYPINLAYHSGIGLEQEASWTGLGWNLNVGAINRNKRGLPDDFKGEHIEKEFTIKQNNTVSLRFDGSSVLPDELFGADLQIGKNVQVYYNNYKGVGWKAGISLSPGGVATSSLAAKAITSIVGSLDFSFDSNDGSLGFQPSFNMGGQVGRFYNDYALGANFNSRHGLTSLSVDNNLLKGRRMTQYIKGQGVAGTGITFAQQSAVPSVQMPTFGVNLQGNVQLGAVVAPTYKKLTIGLGLGLGYLTKKDRTLNGYGYLYSQDNQYAKNDIMDYHRENDIPITKRVPNMSLPVATGDVFAISGQGTGGVFRAQRNDVGLYHGEKTSTYGVNGSLTLEAGAGAGLHFGGGFSIGVTGSYSGPWKQRISQLRNRIPFVDQPSNSRQEYAYFKSAQEMASMPADAYDDIQNEDPVNYQLAVFGVDNNTEGANFSLRPMALNNLASHPGQEIENGVRVDRAPRSQQISQRTIGELRRDKLVANQKEFLYELNNFPYAIGSSYGNTLAPPATQDIYNIDPTNTLLEAEDDQIGEITVLDPNGSIYMYGLPVYNNIESDYAFSVDGSSSALVYPPVTSYTSTDASKNNNAGQENFYSKVTTPKYAYTYLLTNVVSQDYVDLTGDGPTEDDLGYYTNFNYSKAVDDYNWRVPYRGAKLSKGHRSNPNDDKASFTYGNKEIYYLNSVETKTHIAVFITSPRDDGAEADGEHVNSLTASGTVPNVNRRLRKLDEIRLYSKNDFATSADPKPLKTIEFNYDYSLCQGIPNSITGQGKLTLTSLTTTYRGNDKGSLSPYQFEYTAFNPSYDDPGSPGNATFYMDRWGQYVSPKANPARYVNGENPYVVQEDDYNKDGVITPSDEQDRHNDATAWNLSKIGLPSGGEINIEYEADDYAYVQDQKAMQLMEIVGTSDVTATLPTNVAGLSNSLKRNYRRIYFQLERPYASAADKDDFYADYMAGINDLYFKTYQNIKQKPDFSGPAYDYIEGYAQLEVPNTSNYGLIQDAGGLYSIGWVTVRDEGYKKKLGNGTVHPFRKAGWQNLRYSRPDLLSTPPGSAASFTGLAFVTFLLSVIELLAGYYNAAALRGFNKELGSDLPSYLKVNTPDGIKFGGGCRVKRLTVQDNWLENAVKGEIGGLDMEYGQEYSYRLEDGRSSGVAEYEPIIGGEENPLKKPIWYNGSRQLLNFKEKDVYLETPLGESYYPSASVGYSRIEVKNIERDADNDGTIDVTKTASGVSVHQYYTARDYPIITDHTDLEHKGYHIPIPIPTVGVQSFQNHGYSQGYKIELNDMHGKPKSVSVYPYGSDFAGAPVSKEEYLYFSEQPYNPAVPNKLRNKVDVLTADGVHEQRYVGYSMDFFSDEEQNSDFSVSGGVSANLEVAGIIPLPNGYLNFEYQERMYRGVATNKVIYRNGIIKEVKKYSDGAVNIQRNLMFDSETGSPLLTESVNQYQNTVYNYAYPAHWYYEGTQGAYQTQGMWIEPNSLGQVGGANTLLTPGDELVMLGRRDGLTNEINFGVPDAGTHYYLESIVGAQLELRGIDDVVYSFSGDEVFKVHRSGYRNILGLKAGGIQTLANPLESSTYLDLYNEAILAGNFTDFGTDLVVSNVQNACRNFANNITATTTPSNIITAQNGSVVLNLGPDDCILSAIIPYEQGSANLDLDDYTIEVVDGSMILTSISTGKRITLPMVIEDDCFLEKCLDVLQAEAQTFLADWSYDYTDAEAGLADLNYDGIGDVPMAMGVGNDYRFGRKGVWRLENSYQYLSDRKQYPDNPNPGDLQTAINTDGEFEKFKIYNWKTTNQAINENWVLLGNHTRYSPYGYELETRNIVGTYSAELLGYDNSVITAVAGNARYYELAYDGFEDHNGSYGKHGHLELNGGTLSPLEAHTGFQSMQTSGPLTYTFQSYLPATYTSNGDFAAIEGERYLVSAWVKTTGTPNITVAGATNVQTINEVYPEIEGWHKVEIEFTAGTSAMTLSIDPGASNAFVDDVRMHPFEGAASTYVYDPATLWLIAELDDRNYASFFTYDEEGSLVQTKKETRDGIVTIAASRNNQYRN